MRTASVLSRLPQRVALDGSGIIVEVYPAAALRRWSFAAGRYKGKSNAEARRHLVDLFIAEARSWLELSVAHYELCLASDDAFDSLVAALVARASALGLVDSIPKEDQIAALQEGWIAIPIAGSFSMLTGGPFNARET
jgi:predicted RNase H-like nuclease